MKKIKMLLSAFLLCLTTMTYAAKVDTLQVASTAMGKTYKAAVVLPNSYAKSKSAFPVMYLLHGAYGHFSDWLKNTPNKKLVHNLADQYNMIIVMPEGETFSFYIDSPVNKESQFETFITQEVVQKVDKTYRTIAAKNGRVITGLSMGGHGALYLSAKHPDLFCAAGSMSGAVDMSTMLNRDSSAQIVKLMQPVFGDKSGNTELYEQNSVLRMADKLKANKLPLIIDCGVDDFLIEPNRELHRRLVYNKVDHDYTERPGAHTWDYWENSLPYHALFFSKILAKNQVTAKK
ncbi:MULTISPECIES: alpha/beta hydrolase [Flavobacterium]|uniref:Alpha/beta hydrolase family protein n=1 Tax=Flavobacterium ginsenosidimutans TaxID=687844 RepID=A0ABZ2QCC3_9FLAO|nr:MULTISPECIES: alpha/beta hydrolase family protein [Flavobacterium]KAF2331875.1 esterase family protein [Flavobacterium ginsenosidimutans]MCV2487190.1 esterase family protein [Flavobacterium sp. SH_e]